MMNGTLFVGFKGKNNASSIMVEQISPEHILLTNSFAGVKKEIDSINREYECTVLFGVDKTLNSRVRIEEVAVKDGKQMASSMNLDSIVEALNMSGIVSTISKTPTAYFCNEAYWFLLKKFSGRAVLIHIPTIKYVNETFFEKMKSAFVDEGRTLHREVKVITE